jgi:hypothetical protein
LTARRADETPLQRLVDVAWRRRHAIKPRRIEDIGRIAEGRGLAPDGNVDVWAGFHTIAAGRPYAELRFQEVRPCIPALIFDTNFWLVRRLAAEQ